MCKQKANFYYTINVEWIEYDDRENVMYAILYRNLLCTFTQVKRFSTIVLIEYYV